MLESERLRGLQDRRLEVGKTWRDRVTPTTDADIGERARLYKGLAMNAAMASMALEGMQGGRGTQEMMDAQTAQIRAARREAVIAGWDLGGFDLVVKDKVALLKAKAEEDRLAEEVESVIRERKGAISGDWKIIDAELPGDFQPTLGDVPPNVNWGNHAQPSFSEKDAFGFPSEPVVKGW